MKKLIAYMSLLACMALVPFDASAFWALAKTPCGTDYEIGCEVISEMSKEVRVSSVNTDYGLPTEGDMVIPSEVTDLESGERYTVTSIDSWIIQYTVRSIVIPPTVRSVVGASRGPGASNLLVFFPSGLNTDVIGDDSIIKIAYPADAEFAPDGSIYTKMSGRDGRCLVYAPNVARQIELPDDLFGIGEYAMMNCRKLETLSFPSGVESIGAYAFAGCSGLSSIRIPEGVTEVGMGCFQRCTSLKSVELNGAVTSIAPAAFNGCNSLEYVKSGSSVTSIGDYAFNECRSLQNVPIEGNVETIGDNSFAGCESLKNITLKSVTHIGSRAFFGCKKLESVIIGGNATFVGDEAFGNCTSLRKSAFPSQLDNPFRVGAWVRYVAPVTITDERYIYSEDGKCIVFAPAECKEFTFPDGMESIGSGAFIMCSELSSITLPASLGEIGSNAFYGCEALSTITIPAGVKTIGSGAFNDCKLLKTVMLQDSEDLLIIGYEGFGNPNRGTHVEKLYMGRNFEYEIPENFSVMGFAWLSSLEIGKCVTEIPDYSFEGYCGNSIVIPASVRRIGDYAFQGGDYETVEIGDGVVEIGEGSFYSYGDDSIESDVAAKCHLKKVRLGNSVETIGRAAFYNNEKLESIDLPASLASIGDYCFYDCRALKKIAIPNSVVSIKEGAFSSCASLERAEIGNGVTTIEEKAFENCTSLMDVLCLGNVPPVAAKGTFEGSHPESMTLHVPAGCKETYAAAIVWRDFGSILEDSGETGVSDLESDSGSIAAEYYTLEGLRVDNPQHGIFICRRGSKVEKIVIP